MGTDNNSGELPILIKLIDAADNLSVQVHPSDEEALKWENQNGKTEMWYVVEAEPDAQIIYGTKENISREELKKAIEENSATELLNSVPSKKGDVFFVEAGTNHAIGAGNLITEIQQNSNVTYRLYDYGRRDKNGNTRELHIDKGIKCARTEKTVPRKIVMCDDGGRLIGDCEYFKTKEYVIDGEKGFFADGKSYHAIINVAGEVSLIYENNTLELGLGETAFVPAGIGKYSLCGKGTMLLVTN